MPRADLLVVELVLQEDRALGDDVVANLQPVEDADFAIHGLRAFAAQEDVELARALPMLRKQFAESLNTDDAREGLMAFLEKRSPHWTGK